MNNLPPDVQAILEGLGVVTYDGTWDAGVCQFTIRDPEFPRCQPSFYVAQPNLTPQSLLSAYARIMRDFAGEFTKQN